ncbi:MAG: hypothetical protein M1313_00780 [Nitrospirae bacterium]|nr:hypothetical protein [Nitrospirota bacterium]
MVSPGPVFLLFLAFFLVFLQHSGHSLISKLSSLGLGLLVLSVLLYAVGFELVNQWPHASLRGPGYFLLWPS